MVTHDPLAAQRASRTLHLDKGQLVDDVSRRPGCRPRHEIPHLHPPQRPAQPGALAPDHRLDEHLPVPDDDPASRSSPSTTRSSPSAGLQPHRHPQRQRFRRDDPDRARQGDRPARTASQAATPFSWYGGKYKDEILPFAQFGVDPETVFEVMDEFTIPDDQLEAFRKNKDGCVIGRKLAAGQEAPDRRPAAAQGRCLPGRPEPHGPGHLRRPERPRPADVLHPLRQLRRGAEARRDRLASQRPASAGSRATRG